MFSMGDYDDVLILIPHKGINYFIVSKLV